jgi:hypothetical protein
VQRKYVGLFVGVFNRDICGIFSLDALMDQVKVEEVELSPRSDQIILINEDASAVRGFIYGLLVTTPHLRIH